MATIPKCLHFLIITLSFLGFSDLSVQSPASNTEEDFNKWVKWNLQSYREKSSSVWQTQKSGGVRWPSLIDNKLQKAEANRVRITVRQDGNGDFRTIKEALNSIPGYNTRRVVVAIGPGIYRYKLKTQVLV